jgi:hypothetical protein
MPVTAPDPKQTKGTYPQHFWSSWIGGQGVSPYEQ